MDTSLDFLNVLPWSFSHSDDSMRPLRSVMSSPVFPGIENNHSGAHPEGSQQTFNSSFDMDVDLLEWAKFPKIVESHTPLEGEVFRPNENLSQIMQSLGLSDACGSSAASDQSTHTATEPFYAAATASGTSDSQNAPTSSNQLNVDVIMHAAADCCRTPTPTPTPVI